jgi:hypothetical protein
MNQNVVLKKSFINVYVYKNFAIYDESYIFFNKALFEINGFIFCPCNKYPNTEQANVVAQVNNEVLSFADKRIVSTVSKHPKNYEMCYVYPVTFDKEKQVNVKLRYWVILPRDKNKRMFSILKQPLNEWASTVKYDAVQLNFMEGITHDNITFTNVPYETYDDNKQKVFWLNENHNPKKDLIVMFNVDDLQSNLLEDKDENDDEEDNDTEDNKENNNSNDYIGEIDKIQLLKNVDKAYAEIFPKEYY